MSRAGQNLRDLISGFFWLIISILFCVEASNLGIGKLQVPGPGFAVLLGGVVLGAFSLLLISSAILRPKRALPGPKATGQEKGSGLARILLVLCAVLAYIALLPKVGFFILTFALMTFMYRLLGRANVWLDGALGLATAVVVYLLFSTWLQIPLPKGPFGF
jgi:putative tricarboxylic transport membrane protein